MAGAVSDRQKAKILHDEAILQNSKLLDVFDVVISLRGDDAASIRRLISASDDKFSIRAGDRKADIGKLVEVLPRHMLACLDSREPGVHAAEVTTADVGDMSWREYVVHCYDLLGKLFEVAAKLPRLDALLGRCAERREELVYVVIVTVLGCALPPELSGAAGGGPLGLQEEMARAKLSAKALDLLPTLLGRKDGDGGATGGGGDVSWESIGASLLTHPLGHAFLPALFDSASASLRALRRLLHGGGAGGAEGEEAHAVATEVAWGMDSHLTVVGLLLAVPAFYQVLAKRGPTFRAPLGLLREALSVLHPPPAPGGEGGASPLGPGQVAALGDLGKVAVRVVARGLAILNTLEYEEDPSFLDQVAADRNVKDLAWEVVELAFDHVTAALRRPPPAAEGAAADEKGGGAEGAINLADWEGLLDLNALRAAEILTDDSNFRERVMERVARGAGTCLSLEPAQFLSLWVAGVAARELHKWDNEDTTIQTPSDGLCRAFQEVVTRAGGSIGEDPASPAGGAKGAKGGKGGKGRPAKYVEAHVRERAGYLFKLLGNLNCFNEELCAEELRGHFARLLVAELSGPGAATRAWSNLVQLIRYVKRELPEALIQHQDLELMADLLSAVDRASEASKAAERAAAAEGAKREREEEEGIGGDETGGAKKRARVDGST